MFADLPPEQVADAVESSAASALWEAGIVEPPVDAFVLAEARGAVVARDRAPHAGRARRVVFAEQPSEGGGEVILLAPEERPERRQWAVAHEVGESLTRDVFFRLGADPLDTPAGAREWLANRLANALLLPRGWFVESMHQNDADLDALKQRFPTASNELIARRWLEVGGAPIVVTVFDNAAVTWRRANFRPVRPPMMTAELECRQAAHETGEPMIVEGRRFGGAEGFQRTRCWPVHEPGWRREILLTEYAGEDAPW